MKLMQMELFISVATPDHSPKNKILKAIKQGVNGPSEDLAFEFLKQNIADMTLTYINITLKVYQ